MSQSPDPPAVRDNLLYPRALIHWPALLESDFFKRFGWQEVDRRETGAGTEDVMLKPGAHADVISLRVRVDRQQAVLNARLILDRNWVYEVETAKLADDRAQSFLLTFGSQHPATKELAARIFALERGSHPIIRADAPALPPLDPRSEIARLPKVYQDLPIYPMFFGALPHDSIPLREQIAEPGVTLTLATHRESPPLLLLLDLTATPDHTDLTRRERRMVEQAPDRIAAVVADLLASEQVNALFLDAADLPSGLAIALDDRPSTSMVDDDYEYHEAHDGRYAGRVAWKGGPASELARFVDARWVLGYSGVADRYHPVWNAVSVPDAQPVHLHEVYEAPCAGDRSTAYSISSAPGSEIVGYLYRFWVGPVMVEQVAIGHQGSGLPIETAHALAVKVVSRLHARSAAPPEEDEPASSQEPAVAATSPPPSAAAPPPPVLTPPTPPTPPAKPWWRFW